MADRLTTILAASANLLFWCAVAGFAALRPEFTHATTAVSELGAWGAPNMIGFNLLGYGLPGLLLAACGWRLGRGFGRPILAWLLALSGAGMALAGICPAAMDDFSHPSTIGHVIGNTGSLLAWVAAMLLAGWSLRKTQPMFATVSALSLGLMFGAFFLYEMWPPGLVQRLTFGIFLGYFPIAALMTSRTGRA